VWIRRDATSDLASPEEILVLAARSRGVNDSGRSAKTQRRGKYQIELGKRHRWLREQILRIEPREMADFYGFEKVACLEACERGDEEFSRAAMRELQEFFFVSGQFLEKGGEDHIFDTFDLSTPDSASKLMRQGFRPYLLCLNEDRTNLWCHPVLHKEEDDWDRIICADAGGYFASTGGGYENIMMFCEALIRNGLTYRDVIVQKVDRPMWNEVERGAFYQPGMGGLRGPDFEAKEKLRAWFEEFLESRRNST